MLNIILAALPILGKLIPEGKYGEIIEAGTKVAQEVFGTTKEDEIAERIERDPALAEQFKAKLEAETANLQASIADIQNARAMQVHAVEKESWTAWMPAILSLVVTALFTATLCLLFFKQVPESQVAFMIIGAVISEFRGVLGYFFGTSAGSARNGEAMRIIATTAATPSAGQVAAKVVETVAKTVQKR